MRNYLSAEDFDLMTDEEIDAYYAEKENKINETKTKNDE